MSIENGPKKHEKISPGCKTLDFAVSSHEPHLLIASQENKLLSFYLYFFNHKAKVRSKQMLKANSFL